MTAEDIRIILAEVAAGRGGPPCRLRSDNGPEFVAQVVRRRTDPSVLHREQAMASHSISPSVKMGGPEKYFARGICEMRDQ